MVDWCSVNSGTKLNAYNWYRSINNALKDAIESSIDGWNFLAKNYELSFPDSKWVIPIITDGVCGLTTMPEKKFWAIRIEFNQNQALLPGLNEGVAMESGLGFGFNIPLPKQSIDQMWHALVKNVDTYVDGSEYWPYQFEEGDTLSEGTGVEGSWYQGIQYEPMQKFGILADGPVLLRNAAIIISIAALLYKMGLSHAATDFYRRMIERRRYNKLRQEANENEFLIKTLSDYVNENVVTNESLQSYFDRYVGMRLNFK